jgi:hypothetical protein
MRVHTHCAEVHSLRAAAAVSAAVATAEELGHHGLRRDAAGQREAMAAIAGDQKIGVSEGLHRADRGGLLTRGEVAVADPAALYWRSASVSNSDGADLAQTKGPPERAFRSSGGGIRTRDLRVMSPTSYQTAPPRVGSSEFTARPSKHKRRV